MARGMWKGSIAFGLVTIGVELYNSEAPSRLDLDLLDKRDMSRIGYLKINKRTGKPVDKEHVVHGYHIGRDQYVMLSDADIRSANPRAAQTIDILGFLPADAIASIYYERPYVASPLKGSEKAYALFYSALETAQRIGLAEFVIRTRKYLAAVYPYEHALIVQTLRYHEEIHDPRSLGVDLPKGALKAIRPSEQAMAKRLIADMAIDWNPASYRDTYRDDLLKMIKRRSRDAKPVREAAERGKHEPKVLDLMDALRRSVASKAQRAPKRAPRRSATHKRSA